MTYFKPIYIVDIFKDIVSQVSNNLTPGLRMLDNKITSVHYQHGHPLEIIETLAQRDKTNRLKFDKYPLIALFQDFPETISEVDGAPNEVTLHLIIARSTRADYKSGERYDHNFKPFLYPIYHELLKQIYLSGKFLVYDSSKIRHTKIDRLYWGKEGLYNNKGNIFNDFLDVIEIRNLKLKTFLKIC